MKNKKNNKRNSANFVFKDRSGRVHTYGGSGGEKQAGGHPRQHDHHEHQEHRPAEKKAFRREDRSTRHDVSGTGGRSHEKKQRRDEGKKFRGKDRDRGAPREPRKIKAMVDKNHKGFAFLIFDDKKIKDGFLSPRDAEAYFHGDRVEVLLGSRGEIQDIRVLAHRFRELMGRYSPHPVGNRGGWVIYERKRAREEVFAPKGGLTANTGDWVRAKIHFHEKGPLPVTAEVIEVYGEQLPARADIGMVAGEYNLIEEHPEAAIREAESFRLDVSEMEFRKHKVGESAAGRVDLRKVPFITIDGETARDFDDAVFVERHKSGYVLWVAIADVSHYVTPGSALDREAQSRGTSVYFPEKAFHMLPRALSENLCSLKPNEPRLSMVARMEYDRNGSRLHTELMEAVIESHRRATYNQIQEEWEANRKNKDWEFEAHFGLYAKIREARALRGSIDFDLPEAELKVSPDGEVISILQRARLDAHRLIEEFMIAANEAVTEWMMERSRPFVYRIHDLPANDALERFQMLAASVGVKVSLEAAASPKVMADLVRRLEGHPAQALLNTALLRSMKQAVYSATHGIHYGLASEGYTHFTSPIRRYPDLVVHRLLREALRAEGKKGHSLRPHEREKIEQELAEICEHCSYRERLASDAERESIKLKQVRAMVPKVGEEFDGKVVGMVETGLFVEVPEPFVEGFISRDSMMDDFYEFDEDRMIFFGRRKRRTFKVGDRVKVRLLRADLDKRQIDFGLLSGPERPEAKGQAADQDFGVPGKKDRFKRRYPEKREGKRGKRGKFGRVDRR
jgi:ribonuclease R